MMTISNTTILVGLSFGLSLLFMVPAGAQETYDSTAPVKHAVGNYTGSQTQTGGETSPPVLNSQPHSNYSGRAGDSFDANHAQEPEQEASVTGTPEDRTFSDGPLSTKEMRFRNLLLPPVACEEPLPKSALFPPIPQVPSLPSPYIEKIPNLQDPQFEKIANQHFETAAAFVKAERLQQASEEFALAITYSPDELHMREQISAFLRKRAAKCGKKKPDQQTNFLRLAVLYDQTASINTELLNQCLKDQGKEPGDVNSRTTFATQFESLGNYRLAVAEWLAVVKLSDTLSTRARLTSALINADCDREAVAELRRLVSMDWPESKSTEQSVCHRQLAEFFLKYSHHFRNIGAEGTSIVLLENAAMDARRAVVLNPLDSRANKVLFNVALESVALCPNEVDNHMLLAAAYMLKGDLRRAKMAYAECSRLEPSDPRLPVARVVYHQMMAGKNLGKPTKNSIADSIANVKGLIDDDPKNDQLWVLLGRLHEQASDSTKAKECFDKAKAIHWSGSKESASP